MLYSIGRFISKVYFFIFNRISVEGRDNIPSSGGLVICPNHIHWLDPMLVGICTGRIVYYMAKAELFDSKFFAFILKAINAFPVRRGSVDISAIKNSFKIINNGGALGIFLEGTRSKDGKLLPAEPGAALIALKTNAPVVPIRISGSYKLFGHISVKIGKPFSLEEFRGKKLTSGEIASISQLIMDEIGKLS